MWCNRRIKKISQTDGITNEEILEIVSERKSMWKSKQLRRNELKGQSLSTMRY